MLAILGNQADIAAGVETVTDLNQLDQLFLTTPLALFPVFLLGVLAYRKVPL